MKTAPIAKEIPLRELKKIEKRRRIVAAARELFEANGYEATATQAIADRAGIANGTLFLYVKDKRSLLLLVLTDELDALTKKAVKNVDRDAELLDQLIALFRPRYAYLGRDPELSLNALGTQEAIVPVYAPPNYMNAEAAARHASLVDFIISLVGEQKHRGRIDSAVDERLVTDAILALYIVEINRWLMSRGTLAAGVARLKRTFALLLDGVLRKVKA